MADLLNLIRSAGVDFAISHRDVKESALDAHIAHLCVTQIGATMSRRREPKTFRPKKTTPVGSKVSSDRHLSGRYRIPGVESLTHMVADSAIGYIVGPHPQATH